MSYVNIFKKSVLPVEQVDFLTKKGAKSCDTVPLVCTKNESNLLQNGPSFWTFCTEDMGSGDDSLGVQSKQQRLITNLLYKEGSKDYDVCRVKCIFSFIKLIRLFLFVFPKSLLEHQLWQYVATHAQLRSNIFVASCAIA